jgi:2,4-dienoyl-CoA reductase-like NADH-dependent reductase (Old Yellow Enzyme family)
MNNQLPILFSSINLRELTLKNRVVVSPMCQYSSVNGCAQDWHLMHLGNLCIGGSGMVIIEMTNVTPEGRITPNCMGLYNDETEESLKRIIDFCKSISDTPIAVQIAHAGRKASTRPPWGGREPLTPDNGGWQTVAPSAVASGPGAQVPRALEADEIEQLVDYFTGATQRAARIGFDAVEVHGAHGYLLHQFLSPLSNQRQDHYGGSLENRMRFPLDVFAAMRNEWPSDKPMGMRISATDWAEGGWDMQQSISLARALELMGCDWLDVSSGGLSPDQEIPSGPGYQVPFAEEMKQHTNMKIMTVGMITEPEQAEEIIFSGKADMVAIARGMLYNPRWTWHAAEKLGGSVHYPKQYLRCRPHVRNDVFADRGSGMK